GPPGFGVTPPVDGVSPRQSAPARAGQTSAAAAACAAAAQDRLRVLVLVGQHVGRAELG
ncbi:MAG: hypothetical protein QOD53_950, partial [Thermoleophilaceae bacterium]|nr:hypothetical protein [Thermoleophilaceae bacterium]